YFRRQVKTSTTRPDVLEGVNALACAGPGRFGGKIDCAGESPVILPGRCTIAEDATVAHGKFAGPATEDLGGLVDKKGTNIGQSLPHGDPAKLNRLTTRGVALVWRPFCIAGTDRYAFHCHVEFIGGNLRHGGQHALAEFDPAGEYRHLSLTGEVEPAVEV